MGRFSWTSWPGPVRSREVLKTRDLSWLGSEGDTMAKDADEVLPASKRNEGATARERRGPLESGTGQEPASLLEPSERNTALPAPWREPREAHVGLGSYGTVSRWVCKSPGLWGLRQQPAHSCREFA